jgi:hypothetical protein
MILGLLGYLMEAAAQLRGTPEGQEAASVGRELRDLEGGLTSSRAPGTARGGAPRIDPR